MANKKIGNYKNRLAAVCAATMLCVSAAAMPETAFADNNNMLDKSIPAVEFGDLSKFGSGCYGNRGRLVIPTLSYAVPLNDERAGTLQNIVNTEDSAAYITTFGTTPVIADLYTQGFDIIREAELCDYCCIENQDGSCIWYRLTVKETEGINAGTKLLSSSGADLLNIGSKYLICYTTNAGKQTVTILIFEEVGSTTTIKESSEPFTFSSSNKSNIENSSKNNKQNRDFNQSYQYSAPINEHSHSEPAIGFEQEIPDREMAWNRPSENIQEQEMPVSNKEPASNEQQMQNPEKGQETTTPSDTQANSENPMHESEKEQNTPIDLNKQYGTGIYGNRGRFVIPGKDYAVPLYDDRSKSTQETVDAQDSAALITSLGTTAVIADHYNQGFDVIRTVGEGTVCYIEDENNNKTWYTFSSSDQDGYNKGSKLVNSEGENVLNYGEDYLACYTCNINPFAVNSVTIVVWEKIEDPTIE